MSNVSMTKATNNPDTIAAIATPNGAGGVGIVRISGPQSLAIAKTISKKSAEPRVAHFSEFFTAENEIIDEGLMIYFKGPNSFTGEDVVELQGHGGVVVMDRLLRRVLECGARMARPGEFSERAFLNDKIDLAQAEAIADLISSRTEQAASAAARTLTGAFSRSIETLQQKLTSFRIYIEAAIDFPEEEIDFLKDDALKIQLQNILHEFTLLSQKAKQGVLLQEGLRIVILGRPNAGKSTLLNCLSGKEVAIVTDIPGTTRDVMKETIQLNGVPLQLVDTAGLRETDCLIEQEGISRAWREAETADAILLLVDHRELNSVTELINQIQSNEKPIWILANKIDLNSDVQLPEEIMGIKVLPISAKQQHGLENLAKALLGQQQGEQSEGEFLARRRHLHALDNAKCAIEKAMVLLIARQGELLAEECRLAQTALSEITGRMTADDLLGEIFSSFCIGK